LRNLKRKFLTNNKLKGINKSIVRQRRWKDYVLRKNKELWKNKEDRKETEAEEEIICETVSNRIPLRAQKNCSVFSRLHRFL